MKLFSYQKANLFAGLFCIIYLGAAFLLQSLQDLSPCPLCVLQRWLFFFLLIIFFAGSLQIRTKAKALFYSIITLIISLLGIFLSGRHLWLMYHPPQNAGICIPDLFYLFKQFPFTKAIKTLFWESGDCATMAGSFLGMSIPFWTLGGFLFLALISLWQMIRKNPLISNSSIH